MMEGKMEGETCKSCGGSMGSGCGKCGCMHHKTMPILLILLGLTFLGGAMGWLSEMTVSYTWPTLLLLAGLLKLGGYKCKCC